MESHTSQSISDLPSPFESYSGDGPYSFISYAHADKVKVYQTIRAFREKGINIWYDEGIPPAGEWVDELAQAIKKSASFVVFVSPRSVDSRYVRMEVQYALSEHKEILTIFLEETKLPPWVVLMSSTISIDISQRDKLDEQCFQGITTETGQFRVKSQKVSEQEIEIAEEEIDYGMQLWSLWTNAMQTQNIRFAKRANSTPKIAPEKVVSRIPIETKVPQKPVEQPKPSEKSNNVTGHPFALDVKVSESESDQNTKIVEPHRNEYAGIFKWIPPGKITILVPYSDERRLVHVRDGFWLGEYVVTQGIYLEVMGSNPSFSELGFEKILVITR